ncbi:hypothetical protein CDIK_3773 [Cucumispora dikerogammari]|nr:hypothetical protein CDIK_3773 [Cucumispora dikerogammari]
MSIERNEKLTLLHFFVAKSKFSFISLFKLNEINVKCINKTYYLLIKERNLIKKLTETDLKVYLLEAFSTKMTGYLDKFPTEDSIGKESFEYTFQKITNKMTFFINVLNNLNILREIPINMFNPVACLNTTEEVINLKTGSLDWETMYLTIY